MAEVGLLVAVGSGWLRSVRGEKSSSRHGEVRSGLSPVRGRRIGVCWGVCWEPTNCGVTVREEAGLEKGGGPKGVECCYCPREEVDWAGALVG